MVVAEAEAPLLAADAANIGLGERRASAVDRLGELMTLYFPQAGPVKFEQVAAADGRPEDRTRCAINLFGLKLETEVGPSLSSPLSSPLSSSPPPSDWETAKERTAQLGLELMENFLQKIYGRRDDPKFGKVFDRLIKDLEALKPDTNPVAPAEQQQDKETAEPTLETPISPGQLEALRKQHLQPLVLEHQKTPAEMEREVMGPLLASVYSVSTDTANPIVRPSSQQPPQSPQKPAEPTPTPASAPPTGGASTGTSKIVKMVDPLLQPSTVPAAANTSANNNPVCELFVHHQKLGGVGAPPSFEEFQGRGVLWGATGNYHGFTVTVKAAFKKRNDAKYEAARLIYERLMGDTGRFKPIDPEIAADIEAKNVVIGRTNVVIGKDERSGDVQIMASASKALSVEDPTTKKTIRDYLRQMPSGPGTRTPPDGKRFISILNEYCQRIRINPPKYLEVVGNESLGPSHCCIVEDFDDKTFISYAFTRKRDAQEDCALRIFEHLLEKGRVDEMGRCINAPPRASELRLARKEQALRGSHNHSMPPLPPTPGGLPHFMMQLLAGRPPPPPERGSTIPEKRPSEDAARSKAPSPPGGRGAQQPPPPPSWTELEPMMRRMGQIPSPPFAHSFTPLPAPQHLSSASSSRGSSSSHHRHDRGSSSRSPERHCRDSKAARSRDRSRHERDSSRSRDHHGRDDHRRRDCSRDRSHNRSRERSRSRSRSRDRDRDRDRYRSRSRERHNQRRR